MIKDKSLSSKVFDFFLYSMCVVVLIAVLAPVLNIFAVSFSSYDAFARGDVGLLPVEFSTKAYETIIRDGNVLQGLKYSVIYTGLGTLVNILLTVITAYPMSRKEMPFRNAISIFFAFTMFFGGGMIPTFLLVQKLGLYDSIWAMIIPGAMQIYNMIIMRTYFQSIPGELMEAARIDGTNEWQTLWQIVLPLSTPVLAILALYYGLGHWNDYFTGLIYLNSRQYQPLQIFLREILIQNAEFEMGTGDTLALEDSMRRVYMLQVMRYGLIVVSSVPMLILYPFVQRYFVQGVMIGALKG